MVQDTLINTIVLLTVSHRSTMETTQDVLERIVGAYDNETVHHEPVGDRFRDTIMGASLAIGSLLATVAKNDSCPS